MSPMQEDYDPYKEAKRFPYIVTQLPENVKITTSELKISGAEIVVLLLMLLLLIYSILKFFNTWKKNYRMPEGVFYFEEKTVQMTVKRSCQINSKIIFQFHISFSSKIGDTDVFQLCALA